MRFIAFITLLLIACNVCMATSIIFPAFDSPLVFGEMIVAHHIYGKRIIGLDRNSRTVQWNLAVNSPVYGMFPLDSNRGIAVHDGSASVIDIRQGSILKTLDIPGFIFGCTTSGKLFSHTKDDKILCLDLTTGNPIWENKYTEPNSNVSGQFRNNFIFLSFSPNSITKHFNNEKPEYSGTNMIVCLDSRNGQLLWKEEVSLSQAGFGVSLHTASGQNGLLCTTDNSLRILDRISGSILRRCRIEKDIDGADFWGNDCIVVCLGGIGSTRRTIQVRNVTDFSLLTEFTVEAEECASIRVVRNIVILNSLYHTIGVDLESKTIRWQKDQRHYTIYDGLLFYGEYDKDSRVLGICDPTTGADTILYSEKVKK